MVCWYLLQFRNLGQEPVLLDQVHPFTHQTAPGCRAGDSSNCKFLLSYRGDEYQCEGKLVDKGNPLLCPTTMRDYTGPLAGHLNPGIWALCPQDCYQVPGNFWKPKNYIKLLAIISVPGEKNEAVNDSFIESIFAMIREIDGQKR